MVQVQRSHVMWIGTGVAKIEGSNTNSCLVTMKDTGRQFFSLPPLLGVSVLAGMFC